MSAPAFLFDTNVWIAIVFDAHPAHQTALDALAIATAASPAIFCRATQQSFLRLASNPVLLRMYGVPAVSNADALRSYESLASLPVVVFHDEPRGINKYWPTLGGRATASPNAWMDAYLAAFAIAGGFTFVTFDAGFSAYSSRGLLLTTLA